MSTSTKQLAGVVLGMCAAALPAWLLFGFMVDDALISARVAHHLATGVGYRFNNDGPVVDAVTPLGFSYLLAPFASGGPWEAFLAAKWLGLAGWLFAAGVLARLAGEVGKRALAVTLIGLASSVPLAAWSVSGMETGLVTALATCGLLPSAARFRSFVGACFLLGLAAGLRPELLPWAFVFALTRSLSKRERGWPLALALAVVMLPFISVAFTRLVVFRQAFPLSLLAKPPDASLGLRYALGALAFSGPMWLLVSSLHKQASERTRASVVALFVHTLAVIYAGGDWMPFYRLFVPVLPSVILAGAELAELSRTRLAPVLRVGAMLVVSGMLAFALGPSARNVGAQRRAVIDAASPVLAGAHTVAALDVGWVGVATDAKIVDLAGVTDPSIARLPGSHTAKRLPEGLLEVRAIDTLVLFTEGRGEWPELDFVHPVEERVSRLLSFSEFRPVARIPLPFTTRSYVILKRKLGG